MNTENPTSIEPTGYRADIGATSTAHPHLPAAQRCYAEYNVRADWGNYADARGIRVAITEYEDDGPSDYYPTELTLGQAEELAQALLDAVAARRAHPPTPAEQILIAYVAVLDQHDDQWGTWVHVAHVREHLDGALAEPHLAAGLRALAEAGDADLDRFADPAEEPGGVEVDGRYYARLRPTHLFRKES